MKISILSQRFKAAAPAVVLGVAFIALPVCTAQTTAADAIDAGPLPRTATLAQIEARWGKRPREELRKAAEAGQPDAQYWYGGTEIDGAQQDNKKAFQWTMSALRNGDELPTNEQAASTAKWEKAPEADLRSAASAGDRGAQWFLGRFDADKAHARAVQGFEWMKKAAEQSLAEAQYTVANNYLGGTSWVVVAPDENEGMKWLTRSADQGTERAQHKLADFLLLGRNAAPDIVKGLEQLRKTVDVNCPRGQYELAMLYAGGNGEPRSPDETPVNLLKRSAQSGYNLALATLAERYRTGLGVNQDFVRAIRLYRAAVEADGRLDYDKRSKADSILDVLDGNLETKHLTNPDIRRFAQTFSLYRKAVEQYDATAVNEIGRLYLRAANVPKDPVEAYRWFSVAAARGNLDAVRTRDQLKTSLSAADLERAAQALPEFKPSP